MDTRTTDKLPKQSPRSTKYHLAIFLAAAAVLTAGSLWRGGGEESAPNTEMALIEQLRQEISGLRVTSGVSELDALEDVMTMAVRPIATSIVAVLPIEEIRTLKTVPLYGDFQSGSPALPASAAFAPGFSGILIDGEGHILTSANVARLGQRVQVLFPDGTRIEAGVFGTDAESFVGVLKLSSVPGNLSLPDLSRGESELRSGEWLMRYGRAPSGRESRSLCLLESLRIGATERLIGILDRPAAPEIDGGPVVDADGRVVGIYVSPPAAPAYMMPINQALSVVEKLKVRPSGTQQSWIGIESQNLSGELSEYFGVTAGALITKVLPDSPAQRAGIQPGDIVTSADQKEIGSAPQLMTTIMEKPPGSSVPLFVRRNSRERVIIVITEPPPAPQAASGNEQTLSIKVEGSATAAGAAIVDIAPAGLAARLGLMPGDAVQAVDGARIRNVADLMRRAQNLAAGPAHLYEIRRGEQVFFIAVKERMDFHE